MSRRMRSTTKKTRYKLSQIEILIGRTKDLVEVIKRLDTTVTKQQIAIQNLSMLLDLNYSILKEKGIVEDDEEIKELAVKFDKLKKETSGVGDKSEESE